MNLGPEYSAVGGTIPTMFGLIRPTANGPQRHMFRAESEQQAQQWYEALKEVGAGEDEGWVRVRVWWRVKVRVRVGAGVWLEYLCASFVFVSYSLFKLLSFTDVCNSILFHNSTLSHIAPPPANPPCAVRV